MSVNTKNVAGRRTLHFKSVDDILRDAEEITSGEVRHLGNWTPGKILKHIAITMDNSVDGVDFKAPLLIRIFARLMKKSFLNNTMKSGFQMPEKMKPHFSPPDDVSIEEGLTALREAIERYKSATDLQPSPVLGSLTRDEYDKLHMRHAEMHLSFIVSAT